MFTNTMTNVDEDTAADEGTSLLVPTNIGADTLTSSASSVTKNARRILLSTTLSRFGSRSWEFAVPLLLLEWYPGSLAAPAALGLASAIARTVISPTLGARADRWDRMIGVAAGTAMQGCGCLISVGALFAWTAFGGAAVTSTNVGGDEDFRKQAVNLLLLALVIVAGVIEALGAQLASVSVKKEWVPIAFGAESGKVDEEVRQSGPDKSGFFRLPAVNLSFINTSMTNIDLTAAMFGPVLAGFILQVAGGKDGQYSVQIGFAIVALLNVVSFLPEIFLLHLVYRSCPALRRQRPGNDGTSTSDGDDGGIEHSSSSSSSGGRAEAEEKEEEEEINPWKIWYNHPSGLPLLTVSLASLYLTALSPAGVVLTAYLVTIGLSPTAIGTFRGIGSFSGVVGISLFSLIRGWGQSSHHGEGGDADRAEASASASSIERLRRVSLCFLSLEVVSVLIATVAHALCETSVLITSAQSQPSFSLEDGRLPWQILLFLGAIVLSRAGLYAFDVGALEIEQYIVDERYRNAVGSVEGALCSLAEMGMYVLSLALSDPSDFGWQVGVSATAVCCGGLSFGSFLYLYHMHRHYHGTEDDGVEGHHCHPHTWQQERDLREFGYHVHLHRHHKLYQMNTLGIDTLHSHR